MNRSVRIGLLLAVSPFVMVSVMIAVIASGLDYVINKILDTMLKLK